MVRLAPVAGRHRHPPSRDLDRVELVQAVIAERLNRAREEEAQLLQRHRRGVVLGEVLVDELAERDRSPVPTSRRSLSSARSNAARASSSLAKPPRCTRRAPRPPIRYRYAHIAPAPARALSLNT